MEDGIVRRVASHVKKAAQPPLQATPLRGLVSECELSMRGVFGGQGSVGKSRRA